MEDKLARAVLKAVNEAKPKLKQKYCLHIGKDTEDAVIFGVAPFKSQLLSEEAILEKAVEILEEACKLVLERFGNCHYESEFYEKQYKLSQALVDEIELKRDNHPDSQSWLKQVRSERDSASTYIHDISTIWSYTLRFSSRNCGACLKKSVDKMRGWHTFALNMLKGVKTATPSVGGFQDLACLLDEIQTQLSLCFLSLLTVMPYDVLEVVSSLTDVPRDEIFPSIDKRKETAIYNTNQRVVSQEHVINEIFEILDSRSRMSWTQMITRPRGLFLLLGLSGTGRTEIAKAVAQHWYCDVSRLVEIDMSEYAEADQSESTSLAGSKRKKKEDLRDRLSEVLRNRPYSVILLDKIEKATVSVKSFLLEVSSNDALNDTEGNTLDLSKSIIFMTTNVGANELGSGCRCFKQDKDLGELVKRDPIKFLMTHDCPLKRSTDPATRERAIIEARKFFGDQLWDSLDKVFVIEFLDGHKKAVCRLLLREIVREVPEGKFLVHISDAALDVLLDNPRTKSLTAGRAIKEALLAEVRPCLSAAGGYKSDFVYVDALVGSYELSFRFEAHKRSLADRYFKQKDGTFGEVIANLRMKVQSVYKFFELRKKVLPLLDDPGQHFIQLPRYLLVICNLLSKLSPKVSALPKRAFEEQATTMVVDNLPTVEEKENIKVAWRRFPEINTSLAKVTRIIVDAAVKIIDDGPLQYPDSPVRYFLLLCLDDDAKRGLIELLTESLRSDSGTSIFTRVRVNNNFRGEEVKKLLIDKVKEEPRGLIELLTESLGSDSGTSIFTCVRLNNNCRGEEVKKLLIDKVKEKPYSVFMFDGIEYADDVLYSSLLEILDDGTLDGGGFTVDFRRSIIILTSEAANKCLIANLFGREPQGLHNVARNQNVKRFRAELLHRVDEIIVFDPVLPGHGCIRLPKHDICFTEGRASTLLATFLFKMFSPHGNLGDTYSDMVNELPVTFPL